MATDGISIAAGARPAGGTRPFHLDFFSHTETLWPARVVEAGIIALQLLLTSALPLLTLVTREPQPT